MVEPVIDFNLPESIDMMKNEILTSIGMIHSRILELSIHQFDNSNHVVMVRNFNSLIESSNKTIKILNNLSENSITDIITLLERINITIQSCLRYSDNISNNTIIIIRELIETIDKINNTIEIIL